MHSLWILAFKNQWSAQIKKPVEFLVGVLTLVLNNSLYLYGIYLIAFFSTGESPAAQEYLISTGMVLTSWGVLNVFGGGLYQLGNLIETGELEAYLAKPRPTLLLIAMSKSHLISMGEIIQGLLTMIVASLVYEPLLGVRMLLISVLMVFAFASAIIFIGSLSFFTSRGSQLSYVILQVLLSLSLFPVHRALTPSEMWILYFTPLLITTTLPRLTALQGGASSFLTLFSATLLFLLLGIAFFQFSLRYYKSKNYIFINE